MSCSRDGRSSNGRTADSESVCRGSTPLRPAEIENPGESRGFLLFGLYNAVMIEK